MSESDRIIIDLEREWFRRRGAKEQAIMDRLGISSTRYYARLNALIDTAAALQHDPVTVNRLRRIRDERARRRAA